MSSKNSTTPNPTQQLLPATSEIHFTCGGVGITVNEDIDGVYALTAAADLAEAIKLFSDRLYDAINDGDAGYCAEMFALGYLAETCSALIRSVKRSQVVAGGAA